MSQYYDMSANSPADEAINHRAHLPASSHTWERYTVGGVNPYDGVTQLWLIPPPTGIARVVEFIARKMRNDAYLYGAAALLPAAVALAIIADKSSGTGLVASLFAAAFIAAGLGITGVVVAWTENMGMNSDGFRFADAVTPPAGTVVLTQRNIHTLRTRTPKHPVWEVSPDGDVDVHTLTKLCDRVTSEDSQQLRQWIYEAAQLLNTYDDHTPLNEQEQRVMNRLADELHTIIREREAERAAIAHRERERREAYERDLARKTLTARYAQSRGLDDSPQHPTSEGTPHD